MSDPRYEPTFIGEQHIIKLTDVRHAFLIRRDNEQPFVCVLLRMGYSDTQECIAQQFSLMVSGKDALPFWDLYRKWSGISTPDTNDPSFGP
jgi:hypothetical protein